MSKCWDDIQIGASFSIIFMQDDFAELILAPHKHCRTWDSTLSVLTAYDNRSFDLGAKKEQPATSYHTSYQREQTK